jgi:hypothetical protein
MKAMTRRRWNELTGHERAAIAALATVQLSFAAAAWLDLARRPASQVRGSKRLWAIAIAVNWIGPLSYFRWGRRHTP